MLLDRPLVHSLVKLHFDRRGDFSISPFCSLFVLATLFINMSLHLLDFSLHCGVVFRRVLLEVTPKYCFLHNNASHLTTTTRAAQIRKLYDY